MISATLATSSDDLRAERDAVDVGTVESPDTSPSVSDSERGDKPRRGRSTSHLKLVPDTLDLRDAIREAADRYATQLDKSRPFNKAALEMHSRTLLDQISQPECYLGFAMVLIGNAPWFSSDSPQIRTSFRATSLGRSEEGSRSEGSRVAAAGLPCSVGD